MYIYIYIYIYIYMFFFSSFQLGTKHTPIGVSVLSNSLNSVQFITSIITSYFLRPLGIQLTACAILDACDWESWVS